VKTFLLLVMCADICHAQPQDKQKDSLSLIHPPTLSIATETPEPVLYRLSVARKQDGHEPGYGPACKEYGKEMTCFLANHLNLKTGDVEILSYSTKETTVWDKTGPYSIKDAFNAVYYALLKSDTRPAASKICREGFGLTVSAVPELLPYIQNRQYCERDSDCAIRQSQCEYDAFNYYEPFAIAYGCEDGEQFMADGTNPQDKCKAGEKPVLDYRGAQCANHKCRVKAKRVLCEAGKPGLNSK